MTERLSQLLHEEATHLTSTAPDPAGLALAGRRLRRRRRVTTGLAVAASVVVVTGAAALLTLVDRGDREPQPVDVDRDAIVWGYGDRVHVDDVSADVPGTVVSLHHTSVGVLVVSTTEDAPLAGPGRLTLVRYDGSTEDLGELETGAPVVTDADRDYYVLAETRGSDRTVVVRDASSGAVRDELELPGSDGSRPPMALDGDTLYVRVRPSQLVTLDLATGTVEPAPSPAVDSGEATQGRTVAGGRRTVRVVDVATGQELMGIPVTRNLVDAELSPGGDFLRVVRSTGSPGVGYQVDPSWRVQVYEVATGEVVPGMDLGDADATEGGWTLSGDVYALTDTGVVRCAVPEGTCDETRIEALPDEPEPDLGDQPLARVVLPG